MMARWLLSLLALVMPCSLAAEPVPEYMMKAALLYNFALFTEWPGRIEGNFNLCILGADPFGPSLDTIDGKPIRGARLTLLRITSPASARQCQVLFLSDAEHINASKLLEDLSDTPILTISDDSRLIEAGVMIGLIMENRRLNFNINTVAARHAHITISSKLLRLAKTVN
jgi:hypothetical protein